jgi:GNAT superfamily N-acetyltransferase
MTIVKISSDADIRAAAALAFSEHARSVAQLPFLPARTLADYEGRIEWMVREGSVYALAEGGEMAAFLGAFTVEDFRNEGPAAYSPDWCMGFAEGPGARGGMDASGAAFTTRATRALLRAFLSEAEGAALSAHGASVFASRPEVREAFSLSGYGGIVLDAARPAEALSLALSERRGRAREETPRSPEIAIRRATTADAEALSELDGKLGAHIRSAPVLMPGAHGSTADEWAQWLSKPEAAAFIATDEGVPAGFMKAEGPQFDVSFAVQSTETFAIDGLFVEPERRGRGIARALLEAIVGEAIARGKRLVSVDCETMNPEAFGFWTGWFAPVSWSLERRWGRVAPRSFQRSAFARR